MARKVIIDCDPGIDDALALTIALFDPRLEVLAVTTSSGNVEAEQCARNVLGLLEKLDPPRYPRIGIGTDPDDAPVGDGRDLHGSDGLGNLGLTPVERQHLLPSDKLIIDRVKAAPSEVTILCLGPLTSVAKAFQRDPSIISQIDRIVIAGGATPGHGDVTPAAEFNMHFDPQSAQRVLRSPTTKTLLPLDVTNRIHFDLEILSHLPLKYTRVGSILHTMLPHLFRSYRQVLGQETIPLQGVLGVIYLLAPELFTCEQFMVDVEDQGSISRGATIIDRRSQAPEAHDLELATSVDAEAVRDLVIRSFRYAGQSSE